MSKLKNSLKRDSSSFLMMALFFTVFVFFLIQSTIVGAQLNFEAAGIAAAIGGGVIVVLLIAIAVGLLVLGPIGWIVAAVLIIAAVVVALFLPGDEEPEQSDDQGDGSDVLEDEEDLIRHMKEERLKVLRQRCDEGIPPITGSFTKRVLKTENEYTYSYTLTACDKAKAFFVRLNGTSGLMKTEFHSIPKDEIFSNSQTINSRRDFEAVCIKIIGDTRLVCIKEGQSGAAGNSSS